MAGRQGNWHWYFINSNDEMSIVNNQHEQCDMVNRVNAFKYFKLMAYIKKTKPDSKYVKEL